VNKDVYINVIVLVRRQDGYPASMQPIIHMVGTMHA